MIHELTISGMGVIDSATCLFDRGFTAVTGETGAGKTMVVTGLGLLTGGRGDAGLIRVGAGQAVVEGAFDLAADDPLADVVRQAGGIVDGEGLLAARMLAARGRSVLGGRSVPAALLGEVVGSLLVIHGQHDQVRLAGRALVLLDAYGGPDVVALADQVATGHAELRLVSAELADLRQSALARVRELDSLTASLAEISAVDPAPGEDAALAAESERLGHADALVSAANEARTLIADAAEADVAPDAMTQLATARRALASASGFDPALTEHATAIRSVMSQLADVAAELASYVADIDADPRRLAAVQQRRADLGALTRRYGTSIDAVLAWAAHAAGRVAALDGADDRIEALATRQDDLRAQVGAVAGQLHAARLTAAARFGVEVSAELAALAMPRARVGMDVAVRPDPDGIDVPGLDPELGPVALRATGIDEVTLVLAANPGAPARPIAQAASGGELSRVMLAIQVVLAGADPVPTMVFDEVDAGVGGAAAIEVGRRLRRLSSSTQVIVVTHLAQVAAFADRQLVVRKDTDGAVTAASVSPVEGEDRVRELSRMLGGLADSQAAGEHARELLALVDPG